MPGILLKGTLLLACLPACAQQPAPLTADAIMARVAANQDRSESERAHYLYVQHARIASRKGNTVRCEETTDTRVTPTPTGSARQLLKLDGRLLRKKQYVTYTGLAATPTPSSAPGDKPAAASKQAEASAATPPPGSPTQPEAHNDDINISLDDDDEMDRDLVENMRGNLTAGKSKDGIGANLFPLTTREQADYRFTLLGREPRNGRDCFHIAFRPKDKDDFGWKGDAWIDAAAFQPVVLRTAMARKIPFAVRALLGTNVPGLGFTIVYAPQPGLTPGDPSQSVWFPTSFGTEFKLHVLFFFNREIVFSAENRDFQKTHVTAEIRDTPTP